MLGTDVVAVAVILLPFPDDDTLAPLDDVVLLFDVTDNDENDEEEDNELEEFAGERELGCWRCCCCPDDELALDPELELGVRDDETEV